MKQQTRPKTSITSTSLITINERDDEKRNKYGKTEQRNKIYIARMKMEAVHDTAGSGFIVNGVKVCTPGGLICIKPTGIPYTNQYIPRAVSAFVRASATTAADVNPKPENYLPKACK